MLHPTVVINVVGLSPSLLGEHSPNLNRFAERSHLRRLKPVFPAVTCSVQSSMLTGVDPREHGIVGNGWFNREQSEVQFWKQSNRLVQAENVWETARKRDASVTCCNMFWWYNMYSTADYTVTPRPQYKADGRKIPDIHTHPPELRESLQNKLGQFPLFNFWGPASSIISSRWIAEASMMTHEKFDPTLTLIYLPHLDYALQKLGPEHPDIPKHVREIDSVIGRLIDFFDKKNVRIMLLSEYGIESVDTAIFINRFLREQGTLSVRLESGSELLDAGASDAFAVADHQIAHVYIRNHEDIPDYREMLSHLPGVQRVLDQKGKKEAGIDHERAGELVLIARDRHWFTYDYWLDDDRAPDFARTVDIHRKPGYDPRELFLEPRPRMLWTKTRIAMKLLKKKLGFRTLMDVIPLDASLVRGSHGRIDQSPEMMPVLMTSLPVDHLPEEISCKSVHEVILSHLFDK